MQLNGRLWIPSPVLLPPMKTIKKKKFGTRVLQILEVLLDYLHKLYQLNILNLKIQDAKCSEI
jgi:hypothetical protein